jgi:hypothetical protein
MAEGLKEDEFICNVMHTPEENVQLIEAEFE